MIAAIILAAGLSRRMGQPKMLLPWGALTVIEHVVSTFLNAGVDDLVVVTGGARQQVEGLLERYPIRTSHNPRYETGEMLSSLQCGLRAMTAGTKAALIGLGDQPQIQQRTIQQLRDAYTARRPVLLVPSFQRRRGHPWMVAQPLWGELLAMDAPASPRDFLNRHAGKIDYLEVDTATILADLDTPEEYRKSRPA